MRKYNTGLQSVALLLVLSLVVYAMPLSAADGTSRATSIGQISAVGAVDLRGVRINGDGTLFSGDRVNVASGAYAKVALGAGPKIEVGSGSDVTVTREADNVLVTMASGNVAFKGDGKAPIHVRVGAYEIVVPGDASGNVTYIGKTAFSVRMLTGSASVRNQLTKKSFNVQKGSERLVSIQTGDVSQPFARLASTVPAAVPAFPQSTNSSGLSKGGMVALLGTVAGAATAIIVLSARNDDTDENASARLAQVQSIENLNTAAATAAAVSSAATTVSTTATAALAAINASNVANKAALITAANATISQANSANARIPAINAQIASLQNQIATQGSGPTPAQITLLNQLYADLTAARLEVNTAIAALNALLASAQASGVTGLPANPNLQPVPPPVFASASVPL